MNSMVREMKLSKKRQKSQKIMWQEFLKCNEILCGDVCKVIKIIFSIPANTGSNVHITSWSLYVSGDETE